MTDRNAPCPCGSGKKYKKCCGQSPTPSQDPVAINRAVAYAGAVGRRREAFCREYIAAKKAATLSIEEGLKREAEALGKPVTCGKGCGECCAVYYVAASLQECEAIVYWLYRHDDVLRRFLPAADAWRRETGAVAGAFETIGRLYGKSMLGLCDEKEQSEFRGAMNAWEAQHIACPFLFDGTCSIYEVRPYVCAGVVSVSPPEWCRLSHTEHGRMNYIKTDIPFEKDMPYFVKPKGGVFFGSLPLLVSDILTGGYATLSSVPGLEGLQQAALGDPEVIAALKPFMS